MSKLNIITTTNEFFYEILSTQLKSSKVLLNQETEFYIVDLLSRFTKTDNIFILTEKGYRETPLCIMMKEADEEIGQQEKKLLYRQIGDLAIYTTGLFPHKKVSESYYQTIGKMAYNNAAKLHTKSQMKDLFRDLSTNFGLITKVLNNIPNFSIKT
jgi:hypothetical protein